MTLAEQVTALATRVGQELKALRVGKANDTAVVHLTGTETIAGAKTFSSAPLVPTGTVPGNPVRRDDARLTDARTPLAHTHTYSEISGGVRVDLAVSVSYAATITIDASLGNLFGPVTMTGSPTFAVPSSGVGGQLVRVHFVASGAQRVITLSSSLLLTSGIESTVTVPSGKRAILGLEAVAGVGWFVTAVAIQN